MTKTKTKQNKDGSLFTVSYSGDFHKNLSGALKYAYNGATIVEVVVKNKYKVTQSKPQAVKV